MSKKHGMKVTTLIKGIALKIEDENLGTTMVFAMPKPARTADVMDNFYMTFGKFPSDIGNVTEGYYISNNTFLTKEDAYRMANYHGLKDVKLGSFTSENLW